MQDGLSRPHKPDGSERHGETQRNPHKSNAVVTSSPIRKCRWLACFKRRKQDGKRLLQDFSRNLKKVFRRIEREKKYLYVVGSGEDGQYSVKRWSPARE